MAQLKRATILRATNEQASLLHAPPTANRSKKKERTLSGWRSEAAILNGVASHTAQGRPLILRIEEAKAPPIKSLSNAC